MSVEPAGTGAVSSAKGEPIPHDLRLVRDAVADLAAWLGVNASDVVVVEALAVTWPNSSLGCPQPGVEYLQRRVDGAAVVLSVAGDRFYYRGGNPLRPCPPR